MVDVGVDLGVDLRFFWRDIIAIAANGSLHSERHNTHRNRPPACFFRSPEKRVVSGPDTGSIGFFSVSFRTLQLDSPLTHPLTKERKETTKNERNCDDYKSHQPATLFSTRSKTFQTALRHSELYCPSLGKMSHASYHQQQNLVLPNISLVFQNVTFPSNADWNTLNPYNYLIYGKAFRFVNSTNMPTNLLLIYELPANKSWTDTRYTYFPLLLFLYPGFAFLHFFYIAYATSRPHKLSVLSYVARDMQTSCFGFQSSCSSRILLPIILFQLYGIFGLVEKQLNLAARHGNLANVRACLKRGTDVNCTDHKCFVQKFLNLFGVLLGIPLLFYFYGPFLFLNEFLGCFFPATAGKRDTPLMWAVRKCHLGVVTFLLQQGADINKTNVSDRIPEYYKNFGHISLIYFICRCD